MRAVVIGIDASRVRGTGPTETRSTGTERYSREVIAALLRLAPQHEYRLYVRPGSQLPPELYGDLASAHARTRTRVHVVPIGPRRLWTHVGLAREIALRPPDALFIPAHVLPLPQAIRRTTRAVVTVHDVGYRYFPRAHPLRQRLYLDWSTAFTLRHAWRVAVDSQATLRDVQRFYRAPVGKLRVAYPGPLPLARVTPGDEALVRRKFDLPESQPYALYVGTLQPRKNLRRLVQAWEVVIREWRLEIGNSLTDDGGPPQSVNPRSPVSNLQSPVSSLQSPVLVLAGGQGWGGEDLAAEVRERGLGTSVRLTGYVDDVEKAVLMRGARVLAYPSLHEGFGLPVLEAQAVGVPVVCGNTSSLPEVAGDAALLVDPLDPRAIAGALRRALCDEAARTELVRAGYRNVERFAWQACAQVILELLEST